MTTSDHTNAEVSDERLREIEPCPFCGKELEFSENLSIHGGGWMHHGDEAERDRPCFLIGKIIYNTPGDLERWNRRSVTSQASEGEVVAQLTADGSHLVYDADEKQALMFLAHHVLQPDDDSGFGSEYARIVLNIMVRFEQALKASPVSKRVERLETALIEIIAWEFPETGKFWENTDGTMSDRPMSYGAAFGSNGERDYMREIARQALQGGRS